jgi:hypothetical protein
MNATLAIVPQRGAGLDPVYVLSFIKTGSAIEKWIGADTQTQTDSLVIT